MNDKLLEAYLKWVSTRPFTKYVGEQKLVFETRRGDMKEMTEPAHWDGLCCGGPSPGSHYERAGGKEFPRSDDKVCARERAWREYCRIRDGLPIETVEELKH